MAAKKKAESTESIDTLVKKVTKAVGSAKRSLTAQAKKKEA